jgi:hypothetical protein
MKYFITLDGIGIVTGYDGFGLSSQITYPEDGDGVCLRNVGGF